MRHTTVVERVRLLFTQHCRSLQIPTEGGIEETILIRNGFYCGRRFAIENAHAIWFCEEDQLKFYRADGGLLCALQNISKIAVDEAVENVASIAEAA